jgi:uncharacterized protein YjiK
MLIFFNKNLLSFDFLIEFRNKFSTESDTTRYSNIKKKNSRTSWKCIAFILEEINSNEKVTEYSVNEERVELKNKRFCFTGINSNNSGLSFEQQSNSLIWFYIYKKKLILS